MVKQAGVVGAVERRLLELEGRVPGVSERPLAVLALALAGMVDDGRVSVSGRAQASRELRATLVELASELPPDVAGDGVDDLAEGVLGKLRVVS